MRTVKLRPMSWLIGCSLLIAGWTQGFAAEKAPYYQGKTLTIVINFAAGGPTAVEVGLDACFVRAVAPQLVLQAPQADAELSRRLRPVAVHPPEAPPISKDGSSASISENISRGSLR